MRLRPAFAALTLIASGGFASAQQSERLQGPLLIPPAPGEAERVPFRSDSPSRRSFDSRGAADQDRGYAIQIEPRSSRSVSPDDPRLASIESWHRRLFGRRPDPVEWSAWGRHFERGGNAYDLLAGMIASDEYFERTGGRFEDWFTSAAAATGRPVTSKEVWEWEIAYRRDPDRLPIARRLLDVSGLFGSRTSQVGGRRPVVIGHDHHGHGGLGHGIELSGYEAHGPFGPGYDAHGHEHGHHHGHPGHEHTAGYGPAAGPASPADLIADWYRTYNGREIQPHELNKWMSDLNKGMPLDEVYASVLGGDEWYIRVGSSAPQWAASTLEALSQRPDRQAVEHWLDRLRRHGGNRFRTALEMVRTTGGAPAVIDAHDDHDHRDRDRDRRDRDDDA